LGSPTPTRCRLSLSGRREVPGAAGVRDHGGRGARGITDDLEEAFRIATRSGLRLHLADYHLIMARNALAANDCPRAREHFEKAEALVQATGYHRRDPASPPSAPN
jgi:hypothetical protein